MVWAVKDSTNIGVGCSAKVTWLRYPMAFDSTVYYPCHLRGCAGSCLDYLSLLHMSRVFVAMDARPFLRTSP